VPPCLNSIWWRAIGLDDDYEVRKILIQSVNNFLPPGGLEREDASNILAMHVT
jgi:hypothetical protein